MKEVAHLLCYTCVFCTPSFLEPLKFFRTSIASLEPETVQLPAFYILFTMFTGVYGWPEKLKALLWCLHKHSVNDCETCLYNFTLITYYNIVIVLTVVQLKQTSLDQTTATHKDQVPNNLLETLLHWPASKNRHVSLGTNTVLSILNPDPNISWNICLQRSVVKGQSL